MGGMAKVVNGKGPLQLLLEAAKATAIKAGDPCTLEELTVMSSSSDPFRLDTPKNHQIGAWLADSLARLGVTGTRHLRGMHYILIGQPKPDGSKYANTPKDWEWLGTVLKAARWLGYLDFDQVIDNRNSPPLLRLAGEPDPGEPTLDTGLKAEFTDNIHPRVGLSHFAGVQPYRLAMVGEKASLEEVLLPIAWDFDTDLMLPTGDLSDTLVYQLAAAAYADDRPLRVFYFSDCDPSGWNMPSVLGHKLRALTALKFPGLDFEVHRVALTPDQVRAHDLPENPLKETERRGEKWSLRMRVEQTEIDALAALRPRVLDQLARDALAPYFDARMADRTQAVQRQWEADAQQVVDDAETAEQAQARADAEVRLAELADEIADLDDSLRVDLADFDLPELPEPPEAELTGDQPRALTDSGLHFYGHVTRLRADRDYDTDPPY